MKYILTILLILITAYSGMSAKNQSLDFSFRHINTNNGLNHNSITDIIQDHLGFIWFATENGLHRYDGVNTRIFLHDADNTTSISGNVIYELLEDQNKNFWVATNYGLNLYNEQKGTFNRIPLLNRENQKQVQYYVPAIAEDKGGTIYVSWGNHGICRYNKEKQLLLPLNIDSNSNTQLELGNITELFFDSDNLLWMGSKSEGLFCYNPESGITKNYRKETPGTIRSNFIYSIHEDKYKRIFIGNEGGLDIYNKNTGEFSRFTPNQNTPESFEEEWIWNINSDNNGDLWLCSNRAGLYKVTNHALDLKVVYPDDKDPSSLNDNNIQCFFEDRQGNFWVGTQRGGINYVLNNNSQAFKTLTRNPHKKSTLTHSNVSAIIENKDSLLIIGTDGGGLNIYDLKKGSYIPPQKSRYSIQLSEDAILALHIDSEENLWTGGFLTGLRFYNYGGGKQSWIHDPKNPYSIGHNDVRDIFKDSQNNIWVATNGGGLNFFNPAQEKFKQFKFHPRKNSISSDFTLTITEDKNGFLWLGTYEGLDRINPETFTIKKYDNEHNLSGDWIYSLLTDSKNQLWVGTNMAIHRYDKNSDTFFNLTDSIDLPNEIVSGILEDNSGRLWISTSNGLASFDPQNGETHHYFQEDGLPSNFFNPGAAYKNNEGILFFGTAEGLVYFNPENIKSNSLIPPVYITDISHAPITEKKRQIFSNDTLTLNFKQSASINLYFSALNYINAQKNQYAVMLEGIDQQWKYIGHQKFTTYTNLSPGEYKFRVKASNNDNYWNHEGDYIYLEITPPYYKTDLAYGIYISAFLLLLYFIWRYSFIRARYSDKLKIQRLKAEKAEELSKLKSDFFINISHELSTPLTLILAPVEKMLKTKNQDPRLLQIIYRNAKTLLRLIHELLETQKIEEHQKKTEYSYSDVIAFIKDITGDFQELASKKNIHINFSSTINSCIFPFSPQDLETIIRNLISNAIKYNKESGSVEINIFPDKSNTDLNNHGLEILLKDTGNGIPREKINQIFDRYYRVKESSSNQRGYGIGLHLTKQLVELHHGTIFLESTPGEGTTFHIKLPFIEVSRSGQQEELPPTLNDEKEPVKKGGKKLPDILIAEDNPELVELLKILLNKEFRLTFAQNGFVAMQHIRKHTPDLIITDIMMPEMSGIELCNKIKTEFNTSHIPVIMLTALNSNEMMVKGLETGADDYIAKPFNPDILLVRIKNLLNSREELQKKFLTDIKTTPTDIAISSADEQFLNKLHQIIESHISDSEYDVSNLASEMNMSSITLYRKIKGLTGQSVNPFFRTIRLKRAYELLKTKSMPIPEVAQNVGFNDVKYFRKCFVKQFRKNPSEVCKEI
ncbi:hybrid sensor histidine kinase/response regulator transcription factor [Marinilabilia rubra]|uniref:histidine kinase n=1 Tax=Marinilabilia rubra TaxID=2162893 RepID=A0A2U2B8M3_9BACT|nr:two-component regulator propeller domain-containing protein [Marinilabilia rubra]PWD99393.1 hypothetical protein DDZ16_10315 [Marinilabilia rubra]